MKCKISIKKILLACFFIISVFIFADGENYYDYKALLVGDFNGNIIKKENTTAVRPLASITKVMTSILTLEKIKSGDISMSDRVTISQTASVIPYGIKLVAGKQYTVEDLLKATIIRSSNNAAYALAEYVSGGDVPSFINAMNNKARQFGLNSLRFCTPHGLPPGDTGTCMDQGNAEDLYGLAKEAIAYKEYLNISRNAKDYIDGGEIKLKSTNALLGKVGGVDGLKTGYHKAAGSNIILTAQRGNDRVIVVILGSNKAKNRNAIGTEEINNYFAFETKAQTSSKKEYTLNFPYSELFRKFADRLQQPEAVLFVIGYSFYDEHVNDIIYQALANPSFTLVIVDFNGTQSGGEIKRLNDLKDPRIIISQGGELGDFKYFSKELLPTMDQEDTRAKVMSSIEKLYPKEDNEKSEV